MKRSDFILLSPEEKKQAVLHNGVLIGKRKNRASMIFLFQVDGFYVETYFDTETREVEEFRMFDHTRLLVPYLESISIDEILP